MPPEKNYKQKYSRQWETDPLLKDWIAPDPAGENAAYCKFCRVTLLPHKKGLIYHANSKKHENTVSLNRAAKNCKPLNFDKVVKNERKIAELKIAAYIVEHSSTSNVDHLGEMIPKLDPKSAILNNVQLHRTKCTMLIKNVLGQCMFLELLEEIGCSPYSIIVDETTDITITKVLCMMIRFFSKKKRDIVTTFYRIVKVTECDATSIYNLVCLTLQKDGLRVEMLVGIGLDGTNVMIGKNHSLAALLKQQIPDLLVIKCTSHSLHLCAEKAAEVLPRQLEFLIRETHNWFAYSSKRLEAYRDLYETMNNSRNPKKIAGFCGTRWLARYNAIRTILDQWEELKLLFSLAKTADKCYMAEKIHDIMRSSVFKCYLTFLSAQLKPITTLNMLFQSENVESVKLLEDVYLLLRGILQKIVVPAQLEKVNDKDLITFDFKAYLMHTSAISLGYETENLLRQISETESRELRERCKNFLVTLCSEVQNRTPEHIHVLKSVALLTPQIATSQAKPSITPFLEIFQREEVYGNKTEAESEWYNLHHKEWKNTNSSVSFWAEVDEDLDAGGNKRFAAISKFALAVLTMPLSNATVERAFSIYSIIKSKLRNRLSLEMLQNLMLASKESSWVTMFTPNQQAAVLGVVQFIGSCTASTLVERAGRKPLLATTCLVTGIAMAALGSWFYAQATTGACASWLPVAMLCLCIYCDAAGLQPVPFVIMTEMFSFQLRGTVTTIVIAFACGLAAMLLRAFHPMAASLGLHAAFWCFAGVCLLSTAYIACIVPETKMKTIDQIYAEIDGKKKQKEDIESTVTKL
ncbi:sugar transporter domain-containing protein [Phthorimaea operculella]|nr:sugar transporter domain-containing protein [Phthorimaea operculella]